MGISHLAETLEQSQSRETQSGSGGQPQILNSDRIESETNPFKSRSKLLLLIVPMAKGVLISPYQVV